MKALLQRYGYAAWISLVVVLALLHGLHLTADFPHHSPWPDWAKYTDEGWYANAAIRAHLLGRWYEPGGFNPAVAVPLWPALVWMLFGITGVSIVAVRGFAVALFGCNLFLTYRLLEHRLERRRATQLPEPLCEQGRKQRPEQWAALVAVTLLVTSPFLFAFSRLALLEPLMLALTLLALQVALSFSAARRIWANALLLGVLMAAMILAKTTAVVLLPAIFWAAAFPLRAHPRRLLRGCAVAGATTASILACWLASLVSLHLLRDFTYFFFINSYPKPHTLAAHLSSVGWSLHGTLWIDPILLPLLGGLLVVVLACCRSRWAGELLRDPLFVSALLAVAGYLAFMAVQDHTQPRYYTVVAVFAFIAVAQLLATLLQQRGFPRLCGSLALGCIGLAVALNTAQTMRYALHPEYTWIDAARSLTAYIDAHANERRLLLATSGDEIALMTGLPAVCDDFGTEIPSRRIRRARPGWYAAWNDLDPAMLAAIHPSFALDQVTVYPALDDPERNRLVLFRLIPHTPGVQRGYATLSQIMPADHISVPVE